MKKKTILSSSETFALRLGVKESLLKTYSGPAGMGILTAACMFAILQVVGPFAPSAWATLVATLFGTSTLVVTWPLCIALLSGGFVFGGTAMLKYFDKYRLLKAQKSFNTPKDRLAAYISLIVFHPLFVLSAMSSDQSSIIQIIERMKAWGYNEDYAIEIMNELKETFYADWSKLAYFHGLQLCAIFSKKMEECGSKVNNKDFMTDTFWKNCQEELEGHFLELPKKNAFAKEYYKILSHAISKRKISKEMLEKIKKMGEKNPKLLIG